MTTPHVRIPRNHLSTVQVAYVFGVTPQTVSNWVRWGLLPAVRQGRGPYYIDPAILPTFDPPRGSHAYFDREVYEDITHGRGNYGQTWATYRRGGRY